MATTHEDFEAVILAAGDYPTRPNLLPLLAHPRLICCDSAAAEFIAREKHTPWRIVGDLDSLPQEVRTELADIIVHEAEQETNDLSKAVRYAMAQGFRRIAILGATGRREDHTLGNISLLIDYMRQGVSATMLSDYGTFIPCSSDFSASVSPGTQVSIFSFGATDFEGSGLRYPLHDFTNWWQGTLNEATDSHIEIHAKGDFLVYVCTKA